MIHSPTIVAVDATDPVDEVLVDILELLIGAGFSDEQIARVLDVDLWCIALFRSFLTAFDTTQAGQECSRLEGR